MEELKFKKSSFSQRSMRCVDVAISKNRVVVRNSKKHIPVVEFTHEEWEAFLLGVKNNEFEINKE